MKVIPAINDVVKIPRDPNGSGVYLLQVVGYSSATYDLLPYCIGRGAKPIKPQDGSPLRLACTTSSTILQLEAHSAFSVSLGAISPHLQGEPVKLVASITSTSMHAKHEPGCNPTTFLSACALSIPMSDSMHPTPHNQPVQTLVGAEIRIDHTCRETSRPLVQLRYQFPWTPPPPPLSMLLEV